MTISDAQYHAAHTTASIYQLPVIPKNGLVKKTINKATYCDGSYVSFLMALNNTLRDARSCMIKGKEKVKTRADMLLLKEVCMDYAKEARDELSRMPGFHEDILRPLDFNNPTKSAMWAVRRTADLIFPKINITHKKKKKGVRKPAPKLPPFKMTMSSFRGGIMMSYMLGECGCWSALGPIIDWLLESYDETTAGLLQGDIELHIYNIWEAMRRSKSGCTVFAKMSLEDIINNTPVYKFIDRGALLVKHNGNDGSMEKIL